MAEDFTRRVLPIFLASPGDLAEERLIVSEVVHRVNQLIGRRLGWIFDLHTWEELPPSAGHPQETINKVADHCKLFIGILWKRWGHPTKSYSSGFEEEFVRAKSRWAETGAPEIWLCFKQIPLGELTDPGPQLQRVLAFRNVQATTPEFLYREFVNSADWKNKLLEWLMEYALALPQREQAEDRNEVQSPALAAPAKSALTHSELAQSGFQKSVPKQLSNLMALLSDAVSSGGFELSNSQQSSVTDLEIARLRLLAATWYSMRVSGETLGAHEINFLYKRAGKLELLSEERQLIFRSVIAAADNVPGWYWFVGQTGTHVGDAILSLAAGDPDTEVQKGAFQLLTDLALRPLANFGSFITTALSHASYVVQLKALDYFTKVGEPSDILILQGALEGPDSTVTYNASIAKLSVLLKGDPNLAFAELLTTNQYLPEDFLAKLEPLMAKVSDDLALKGIEYDDAGIKRISAQELERRGKITVAKARQFIGFPDVRFREIGFRVLIKHGVTLNPREVKDSLKETVREPFTAIFGGPFEKPSAGAAEIILDLYQSHPKQTLEEEVDWFSIDGPIAYQALSSTHFAERRAYVKRDLESAFHDVKAQSTARLRAKLGAHFDELTEYYHKPDVDKSIREFFTAAALAVLAQHGERGDIEYGRKYIGSKNSDVSREAIKIIEKFGDTSDVAELSKIATGEATDKRLSAVRAILTLAPGVSENSLLFIKSYELPIVRIALHAIAKADTNILQENCLEIISRENDEIRLLGLAYLLQVSSRDFLRDTLVSYLASDTYYYNVVCWLDRVLYAPEPLQSAYKHQLLSRIE
jgi:hypothetical protein